MRRLIRGVSSPPPMLITVGWTVAQALQSWLAKRKAENGGIKLLRLDLYWRALGASGDNIFFGIPLPEPIFFLGASWQSLVSPPAMSVGHHQTLPPFVHTQNPSPAFSHLPSFGSPVFTGLEFTGVAKVKATKQKNGTNPTLIKIFMIFLTQSMRRI